MSDIDDVFISPSTFVKDRRKRSRTRRKEKKMYDYPTHYENVPQIDLDEAINFTDYTLNFQIAAVALVAFAALHPVVRDMLRFYMGYKVLVSFKESFDDNLTNFEKIKDMDNRTMTSIPKPSKQIYFKFQDELYCFARKKENKLFPPEINQEIKTWILETRLLKDLFGIEYYMNGIPKEAEPYFWVESNSITSSPHLFKETVSQNRIGIYFRHLIFCAISLKQCKVEDFAGSELHHEHDTKIYGVYDTKDVTKLPKVHKDFSKSIIKTLIFILKRHNPTKELSSIQIDKKEYQLNY